MRKSIFLFLLLWLTLTLAACGKKEESVEYYDIRVESRILEDADDGQWILGRQYYQGEPVSLVAEQVRNADGTSAMDVYIQPAGGERQLLLGGVSSYQSAAWYLDGGGNCFIMQADGVVRLDKDGNMLYHSRTGSRVMDICGLENGRIILLTLKDGNYGLADLDPVTGAVDKIDNVTLDSGTRYIGASGDRLILMDTEGFWHVDLKKGARTLELPFKGTFYTFPDMESAEDFWAEGNKAGIIWSSGMEEKLSRVSIGKEKEIIVVRGSNLSRGDGWLKKQIQLFNQSNDAYCAVSEECGAGRDRSDFVTETNLKLAAGKGADIICEDALSEDIYSMIGNGIFADLTPFMEASGIGDEDYFPAAFAQWKYEGKCYGIAPDMYLYSYVMDKSLLKNGEELTIDTFLDIMLDGDGKKDIFRSDAEWILEFLLQGSEDLWGTVDWEAGSCDFGGERFFRMLQAAKQCAYSKQQESQTIFDGVGNAFGFYNFETESEMEARNHRLGGPLFDDGCHAQISSKNSVMGINANSAHKEGAWQLLLFLLGYDAQSEKAFTSAFPVNRKAFDMVAQREIQAGAIEWETRMIGGIETKWVKYRKGDGKDLTQEKVDEMIRCFEDAKTLPLRTQPLIPIILEESADYFSGVKSKEEVIALVQNRVQLYLDEHKGGKSK